MFTISPHKAVGAFRHGLIVACATLVIGCSATAPPKPATPALPAATAPGAASAQTPVPTQETASAVPGPAQPATVEPKTTPAANPTPPSAAAPDQAPARSEKPKAAKESAAAAPAPPVAAKPATPASPAPVAKPATEAAPTGATQTLYGTITLLGGGKEITDPADLADTTVYYMPEAGAPHPAPGRFRIYTHGKQFEPSTLVVPLGSTVSFPNLDTILHNVFSVSQGATFDLGLMGEGKSADYTFTKPGTAFINCNVHQLMQANVLVVDTPYVTHPDNTGHFKLTGLPAGRGKVWTWNPRANAQALAVTLPSTPDVDLRVVLVRPRLIQHLNKDNKAY